MTQHENPGWDHCDCTYAFNLAALIDNKARLAEWMRSDPELVTRTEEGCLWHHREGQRSGLYFLVSNDMPPAICFCIRYEGVDLLQRGSVVELASWQCYVYGTDSHRAKQTVLFDELLPRYDLLVSWIDLLPGATRYWLYNITHARRRGHHGGVFTKSGDLSRFDAGAKDDWYRQHDIVKEGALPERGARFFLQRSEH